MTSTQMVWVPKQEIEILYGPHEPTRRERREAKKLRNWKRAMVLAPCAAFAVGSVFLAWYQPPGTATAQEAETTTTSTVPPPPPAAPTPETIPADQTPGFQTYRVTTPAWDGLGKLLTDGVHAGRNNRVIPGDKGVAIISANTDPTSGEAATIVVNGAAWRIRERGTVPADNISQFMRRPDVPVLVVISEKPGASRPYVEMVKP